jgi:ectoine hydroxylase-related dioxygenase (phytanoyl-CoA dioxygenase family)
MYVEKAETGKFILFDSTLQHCVTKNLSNQKRIIISMNFTYDE